MVSDDLTCRFPDLTDGPYGDVKFGTSRVSSGCRVGWGRRWRRPGGGGEYSSPQRRVVERLRDEVRGSRAPGSQSSRLASRNLKGLPSVHPHRCSVQVSTPGMSAAGFTAPRRPLRPFVGDLHEARGCECLAPPPLDARDRPGSRRARRTASRCPVPAAERRRLVPPLGDRRRVTPNGAARVVAVGGAPCRTETKSVSLMRSPRRTSSASSRSHCRCHSSAVGPWPGTCRRSRRRRRRRRRLPSPCRRRRGCRRKVGELGVSDALRVRLHRHSVLLQQLRRRRRLRGAGGERRGR